MNISASNRRITIAHVVGVTPGSTDLPPPFRWRAGKYRSGGHIIEAPPWLSANPLQRTAHLKPLICRACEWNTLSMFVWAFSLLKLDRAGILETSKVWAETGRPPVLNLIDLDLSTCLVRTIGLHFFGGPEIIVERLAHDDVAALSFTAQVAEVVLEGSIFYPGLRLIAPPLNGMVIATNEERNTVTIRMTD